MKYIKWMLLFFGITLSMCACTKEESTTKVVLTTGFHKNEIFRIETMSCMRPEIMVYITNMQNQYENIFGQEIWKTDLAGVTLEQNVKETALARIAQIKSMNLLAGQYGVVLEEEEKALAGEVAAAYFASLNDVETESMGINLQLIETMYQEYALADKIYQYIIKDINPEISDDEARTITVQHILIKTYALDGTGKKIDYSESMKQESYQTAKKIWKMAAEGEDFEQLVQQYSEDEMGTYSFGKGEMETAFEEMAFNLGTGEISEIVETSFGYHIIKCINTFNREETDNNKVKIVDQRREEVFGQEYDAFVESLTKTLNEDMWAMVTFVRSPEVNTVSFFDLYEEYFEGQVSWNL